MVPTEKLGEKCFLENVRLFSDPRRYPEKYNLYTGLEAMSVVLGEVIQGQRRLETQLTHLIQVVDRM